MSPTTLNIAVLHRELSQREALCDYIADEVGFRVVGHTAGGDHALALLAAADPRIHVLVVDFDSVEAGAAAHFIPSLRALSPGTAVLLLLPGPPGPEVEALLAHGVSGYLDAGRTAVELTPALRTIGMGRRYRPHVEADAA